MRSSSVLSLIVFCISSTFALTASGQIQNVRGSFKGHYASAQSGIAPTALPHIEQDNRTFQGQMALGPATNGFFFDLDGAIAASDICQINGREVSATTNSIQMRYRARWISFGDGAGGIVGPVVFDSSRLRDHGTLAYLRPYALTNQFAVDPAGDYAGTFSAAGGGTGNVSLLLAPQIQDGTSNTLVSFFSGRARSDFQATVDVNATGRVAGVGVAANGSLLVITGVLDPRLTGRAELQYVLSAADGTVLQTGSIIAILIG